MAEPFADRLTALVAERRSQVCLGLDPDPGELPGGPLGAGEGPEDAAAAAVVQHCRVLIERAGRACVAVKLQLACFERLGPPGWGAVFEVAGDAREAGLLVLADGKRGDVPISATAYAQALLGGSPSPWGTLRGLGADAFTVNPMFGSDALEPFIDAAANAGAGVFCVVRTSNTGAAELLDTPPDAPLHERVAALVDGAAGRLAGTGAAKLSGLGAVIGATAPSLLGRLRELMPRSIFLLPGVGAQGGSPESLGPAFAAGPASALVPVSRSIAGDPDPAAAAERLRDQVWRVSGG